MTGATHSNSDDGCFGPLAAGFIVLAMVAFFVPFSIPFKPKSDDVRQVCAQHGGYAEMQATLIDIAQREGVFACKDGTVRWAEW
jgi:hypothetical protein